MKSLLPIIAIILLLTGAITYSLAKRSLPKKQENTFGIAANQLPTTSINESDSTKKSFFGSGSTVTPTPTATPTPKVTVTPTPTPSANQITPLPTVTEKDKNSSSVNDGKKVSTEKVTKVTKTTVCTPVYGQADTCTEHIVVDTGLADSMFFNFAGFSYLAGLVSFIKAKSIKK